MKKTRSEDGSGDATTKVNGETETKEKKEVHVYVATQSRCNFDNTVNVLKFRTCYSILKISV